MNVSKYLSLLVPKWPSFRCKEHLGLLCCMLAALPFLVFPQQTVEIMASLTSFVVKQFAYTYVLISSALALFSLFLALSPLGRVRLGGVDSSPDFSLFSWISMLFAAGMGSGLIFWGVAEPIYHLANPPAFAQGSSSPQNTALALTYFHWGIHAWSIYAVAGLAIAWFAFNHRRAMNISASFTHKSHITLFYTFDLIAVISLIFGVAGTLANTVALLETGMEKALIADFDGTEFRLLALFLIAIAFTASSALGLERGIRWLSVFNLWFVLALLAIVIVLTGPIDVFLRILSSSFQYLKALPELSFTIDVESRVWSEGWSVIYLIWWIAWAPFVGPFIARISRGRTVRQFLLCVIFVPTFTSIVWFSAFAGGAFSLPILPQLIEAVNQDYTRGLFTFLSYYSIGEWLSLAAMLLLITFVITSADSAVFVSVMLTDSEKRSSKFLWSALLVVISVALIYKNNVDLNKQIAIAGAIPFTIILLLQVVSMLWNLGSRKGAINTE